MATRRRQVIWAPLARAALEEAAEYIAQESRPAADHLVITALEVAAGLVWFAERGRVVPEIGDPSFRELFVFRFRLLYRVDVERIRVVAFLHGARDFERWRRDPEV